MVKRWRTWSASCTRFCTCRCKLFVQMMCNMYMFCPCGETCIERTISLLCLVSKVMTVRRLHLLLYLYWKFCRLIQDDSKHIHCMFAKATQWDDGGDAFRWRLKIYGGHCQACCAFSTLVAKNQEHFDLHHQRCKSKCSWFFATSVENAQHAWQWPP